MYLRIYRLPKKWLNQPVKSAISEHPSTFNVLMGAKHLWSLHHSTFIIFLITLRGNYLQNISFIRSWNLRCVCLHIDCRWQVSCSGLWQFAVPYSNVIFLKTKNFSWIFCSIYGISIKFSTFSNRRWSW